ncbi:triose-phosphate isomerase [Luteimicrobium subarcticum]|uniref:Triosephosphate isomerase n=1 Tax=Luteimicrobium subarcticum TaxID=620910 RepID=A0A2M8WVW6_9MICO|nr:triose-phosphate isomerase family protein [Luteimicrobium subarcticum]PJI95061.1 triosephosphate isomerase [Luteimicrobium subarcticum]
MALTSRPLAAVSLKAYLGQSETLRWVDAVLPAVRAAAGAVEVVVLPVATALDAVGGRLAGVAALGAQQVSAHPAGAFTGEVPASVLGELGVVYAEIAHAERRSVLGETDGVFAAQVARCREQGIVPLVCVGEDDRVPADAAAAACAEQLDAVLGTSGVGDVLVAYEPRWAIGAAQPADAEHVLGVTAALRRRADRWGTDVRLLYGGTAGPGTWTELRGSVDGIFLGRRAHDPDAFARVLDEMERNQP